MEQQYYCTSHHHTVPLLGCDRVFNIVRTVRRAGMLVWLLLQNRACLADYTLRFLLERYQVFVSWLCLPSMSRSCFSRFSTVLNEVSCDKNPKKVTKGSKNGLIAIVIFRPWALRCSIFSVYELYTLRSIFKCAVTALQLQVCHFSQSVVNAWAILQTSSATLHFFIGGSGCLSENSGLLKITNPFFL